jgi:DNA adenine methylase
MKYMGSKNRLAKHLLPIILKDRKNQYYVEPFCGGCNMIDKVDGKRIGNDFNEYLISLLEYIKTKELPYVTKEEYKKVKENKDNYEKWYVGHVGINCSYSGKWFGGYAGLLETKDGIRDYIKEAIKNCKEQSQFIKDVEFNSGSYDALIIPNNSIIYCDPPYKNTTKYKDDFNHDKFYDWCIKQKENGHEVFISEYYMPKEFECIYERKVNSCLSANGKIGGVKCSIERLYKVRN